jgi:hypothetical protein
MSFAIAVKRMKAFIVRLEEVSELSDGTAVTGSARRVIRGRLAKH